MRNFLLFATLLVVHPIIAQDVSRALQKPVRLTAQNKAQWQKLKSTTEVSFANSNVRYSSDIVPDIAVKRSDTLIAWRGEKVHTQLLVWGNSPATIRVQAGNLVSKNATIPASELHTGFVDYVMTDEFRNGCGHRKPEDFDSFMVADLIRSDWKEASLKQNKVQPIWVSVKVPDNAQPGIYSSTINVKADKNYALKLYVKVLDKSLPPPAQWTFNLDLWQHPAAIARVHHVALWSDEHFKLMKPYYTMLANAGQKNITASIVNEPWGHQTYDDFPSLIKWTKKKDGSWQYDYSLFDKYISFVMDCGINQRINCYSMVPWKIAFPYYDEALGKEVVFTQAIGTPEYNEFWKAMLTDFTAHLKNKGWFVITTIAMDERPMEAMQSVIKLLKEVDTNWKVALAGNYHPEIEKDIYDYCVASRFTFGDQTLKAREDAGKLSTWYTCCTEVYPNGFTFSPAAEHVWIGWYTAAKNMNGYLRWAYNSWPASPLTDSRFTSWPAGDTYQVYPGPLTSIRFEKLIEGIQDYEKINILKKEYKANNQVAKLTELQKALELFDIEKLKTQSAEDMVLKAKKLINPPSSL